MRKYISTLFIGFIAAMFSFASPAQAAVNFVSWPKDIIYVVDQTDHILKGDSPMWPVRAAAERWDDSNPVDFRYTTGACPSGHQCVYVTQVEMAEGIVGRTTTATVGENIVSSKVAMDKSFGLKSSYERRRNGICHELGHSLGLKHRTTTASCMYSANTTTWKPDATDIRNLDVMYGYR